MPGVPGSSYARLTMSHPGYAVDEVTVDTSPGRPTPTHLRDWNLSTVPPDFTYTLEPARPVQGRITDKETGKPIEGMKVPVTPMRKHGGMPFSGRTDKDGRYRISGHKAEMMYFINAYPRADSGYLAASETRSQWPAGARFLEVNLALERGRLIHGTVIGRKRRAHQGRGGDVSARRARTRTAATTGNGATRCSPTARASSRSPAWPARGSCSSRHLIPTRFGRSCKTATFRQNAYPHGFLAVTIPKEGEAKPVEIADPQGRHPGSQGRRSPGPGGSGCHGLLSGHRRVPHGRLEQRARLRRWSRPHPRRRPRQDLPCLLHQSQAGTGSCRRAQARPGPVGPHRGTAPADGHASAARFPTRGSNAPGRARSTRAWSLIRAASSSRDRTSSIKTWSISTPWSWASETSTSSPRCNSDGTFSLRA